LATKRLKIVELVFKIQIIYKSNIEVIQNEIIEHFEKHKKNDKDMISVEEVRNMILEIYKK